MLWESVSFIDASAFEETGGDEVLILQPSTKIKCWGPGTLIGVGGILSEIIIFIQYLIQKKEKKLSLICYKTMQVERV